LQTLLTRREQARSAQTHAGSAERPELFQPQQPSVTPDVAADYGQAGDAWRPAAAPPAARPEEPPPEATTSRLLEAKKRAQKRRH
jgi:hypothetical protein